MKSKRAGRSRCAVAAGLVSALMLLSGGGYGAASAETGGASAESPTETARGISVQPVTAEQITAATGGEFDPSQSAGLFVGIREFVDGRIAEVPYAVDDAVDLAHLFSLELKLIHPSRVTLALSGEPASEKSRTRLALLLKAGAKRRTANFGDVFAEIEKNSFAAGANGVLIVSYASHGYIVKGESRQRLFARDSTRSSLQYTGIPVEYLFEQVAQSPSPRRIVLVDACRESVDAGNRAVADPRAAMSRDFADAIASSEGTVILQATTPGGYSYDDPARQNGVFTAEVIEGLNGAAGADARGYVTPETLKDYVDEGVRNWVARNRPHDKDKSKGISYRTDPAPAAHLPLAVNPMALEKYKVAATRRERLLNVLRQQMDFKLITGDMVQEVVKYLESASDKDAEPVLLELEALEIFKSRGRTRFAQWWKSMIGKGAQTSYSTPTAPIAPTPATVPTVAPSGARQAYEPELVWIPGGTFEMGSPASEEGRAGDEGPVHSVTVDAFWMGKYEVTFEEYDDFCDETGRSKPSDQGWGRGNRPVINVSWNDAVAYCEWLSRKTGKQYRLPTEAEWEYAARAGTRTPFSFGKTISASQANYDGNYTYGNGVKGEYRQRTTPVGSFSANAFGLHDMHGNVWEWCADWNDASYYASSPSRNPMGPTSGTYRVLRGGSWDDTPPFLRSASRIKYSPGDRSSGGGFRPVLVPRSQG